MEAAAVDIKVINTIRKTLNSMSKIGENIIIVGSKNKLSFRTVNSTESILCVVSFDDNFFDSYTFALNDNIVVELPFKYLVQIFRAKWDTMKIRLNSREKIQFILQDKYGSLHTFDLFLAAAVIMDISPIQRIFSTIDCKADIFDCVSKIFGQSSIVIFSLTNNCISIETEDKSTAMLTIKQSESCRIDARFNLETKIVFGDLKAAIALSKTFSDKLLITIEENGPFMISADIGGNIHMKSTIANMNVAKESENSQETDEIFLTTPSMNRTSSAIRVEAPEHTETTPKKKRIYSE